MCKKDGCAVLHIDSGTWYGDGLRIGEGESVPRKGEVFAADGGVDADGGVVVDVER